MWNVLERPERGRDARRYGTEQRGRRVDAEVGCVAHRRGERFEEAALPTPDFQHAIARPHAAGYRGEPPIARADVAGKVLCVACEERRDAEQMRVEEKFWGPRH